MESRPARFVWILALALFPACVPSGRYDAAVADANREKTAAAQEHDAQKLRIAKLEKALDDARIQREALEAMLDKSDAAREKLQKQLDDQVAVDAKLRTELEKQGKDVDALLKAHAAERARAALYKELLGKFHKMIDAGDLSVSVRDGRMVLQLPNDVLFDSGKAELKPSGKAAIEQVAVVLRTIDRHFQVAGHTDDEPIKLSPFASNWELSTVRALTVVSDLVKHGVKPQHLSAAGYGEFDPVAPNTTPKSKAKNRRIEITVVPMIDELVSVPQ